MQNNRARTVLRRLFLLSLLTVPACGDDPLAAPLVVKDSTLIAIVTNTLTKAKVVGATVEVQGMKGTTDGNGICTIGALRLGTFPVKVTHPDYADQQRDVNLVGLADTALFDLQPKL